MDIVKVKEECDPLSLDMEFNSSDVDHSEDSLYCCQVCNMLLIGFSKYSPEEQAKIVEEGRPTPQLTNLVFNTAKGFMRHFSTKKYIIYEWLTGCEQRGKLFCWACLLFSEKTDPWTTTGISDLSNLSYTLKRHSTWECHIEAMLRWKTFGMTAPDSGSDESIEEVESYKRSKEEEVMINREILKKFIGIAFFISVHELCSRRGRVEEAIDPIDQCRYEEFVDLVAKYDSVLRNQLTVTKTFLSSRVRNSVFLSIIEVVSREIIRQVSQSNFVSMIVDEVAEMGRRTLVSTIIRYVTVKGELVERFLNFRQVPSERRADSLYKVISENVKFLDCPSKLFSLSCDGGVLKADEIFKLQTKVKELCPNVCFLHYFEHRLTSILAQSVSTIYLCKRFFFTLNGLAMTFLKSKELNDWLNSLIRERRPGAADFRWSFNGSLINNVRGIRQPLIDLFQNIVDNKNDWHWDTYFACSGFLDILTDDLPFNFLLILLDDIFIRADHLSGVLINKIDNVDLCIQNVKDFSNFIRKKRNSFDRVYNEALIMTGICERQKDSSLLVDLLNDSSEKCRPLFDGVISNLITQLNFRFTDLAKISFLPLTDFKRSTIPFPSALPGNFDINFLQAELNVLWESSAFKKSDLRETLRYLRIMGLDSTLPQTTKLCELTLALPVSKGNSTLERVENYIQTTSVAHRLSTLPVLNIEKDLVKELLKNKKFYEDIISIFSTKEPSIPLLMGE